jgi:hypothetical protein
LAKGNFFSIEWDGLEEFEDMLEELSGDALEEALIEELSEFGALLEEAVRSLMPRDESDLESSYIVSPAKPMGNGVGVEGGSNSEYALRRHEEPYRSGTYPKYDNGSKFPDYYVNGRGARTRSKGGFRGEPAGRKYQERAVDLLTEDWEQANKRALEKAIAQSGGG